ncbi:hypothetical protein PFICI_08445 [Pestalotiopsis fici W106-1]|uniref:3-hydroxyacyl-CoA dehydrogenase NAD binding domain-containing protein n=1 Tax=Pestalotiopsis fici (strain W106-1 / CGMCC3.15140) TaxID=1229662 RepID=W3X6V5_PESFW|nr:uncharacterized protein PFICI_08445 [Pestalotiopsis fici W106-1]ETS80916.1 hypothetical protein PFICI_08445 [Pestalotiopsis fici W106-1]
MCSGPSMPHQRQVSKAKSHAISGQSSGMERSTALVLAQFGARVSFCDHNKRRIAQVEAEIVPSSLYGKHGVLSNSVYIENVGEVVAWIHAFVDKFGRLDGAINAVALEASKVVSITEMKSPTWHTAINANLPQLKHD